MHINTQYINNIYLYMCVYTNIHVCMYIIQTFILYMHSLSVKICMDSEDYHTHVLVFPI